MAVSFIGGGNWNNWKKPPTCLSQVGDKLSLSVVSSIPRLGRIQTHNFSEDRHRLHR